ncbi:hypothetical protein EJB05_33045, partial [Eragrostis curvula]
MHEAVVPQQGIRHTIAWRWASNGRHTDSSAYKAQFHESQMPFSSAAIRKAKVEPKASYAMHRAWFSFAGALAQDSQDEGIAEWLSLNVTKYN